MVPDSPATLLFRLERLELDVEANEQRVGRAMEVSARHEEQINGDRGISKAIGELKDELKALRRAVWTVGGGIVVSAVGFALAVLQSSP